MKTICAKVLDSTHLELSQPIPARTGELIQIAIPDEEEVTPKEIEVRRAVIAQMKEFGQRLVGRKVDLGDLILEGREELENRA